MDHEYDELLRHFIHSAVYLSQTNLTNSFWEFQCLFAHIGYKKKRAMLRLQRNNLDLNPAGSFPPQTLRLRHTCSNLCAAAAARRFAETRGRRKWGTAIFSVVAHIYAHRKQFYWRAAAEEMVESCRLYRLDTSHASTASESGISVILPPSSAQHAAGGYVQIKQQQ